MNPEEYIAIIEKKWEECKNEGQKRFSVEWGKFSFGMNRSLKEDTKNALDPHLRQRYRFVFSFWQEMSFLLSDPKEDKAKAKALKSLALSRDNKTEIV